MKFFWFSVLGLAAAAGIASAAEAQPVDWNWKEQIADQCLAGAQVSNWGACEDYDREMFNPDQLADEIIQNNGKLRPAARASVESQLAYELSRTPIRPQQIRILEKMLEIDDLSVARRI